MAALSRENFIHAAVSAAIASAIIGLIAAILLNTTYNADPDTSFLAGGLLAIVIFSISLGEGVIVATLLDYEKRRKNR